MSKVRVAPQKILFNILMISFTIYAVVTIVTQAGQIKENKNNINSIKQQILVEEKRAQELDEETAKIGTDEFIEKQAKEKLGYVKSNEKIYYDKAQ